MADPLAIFDRYSVGRRGEDPLSIFDRYSQDPLAGEDEESLYERLRRRIEAGTATREERFQFGELQAAELGVPRFQERRPRADASGRLPAPDVSRSSDSLTELATTFIPGLRLARKVLPWEVREAASNTFWGDFGGGLAELGALPATAADLLEKAPLVLVGPGAKLAAGLVPEGYREEAREKRETLEAGRELSRRSRFEAGIDSPFVNALIGTAAENADLVAAGAAAPVKAGRALGRYARRFGDELAEATGRGIDEGVVIEATRMADDLAAGIERDLPRWRAELAGREQARRMMPDLDLMEQAVERKIVDLDLGASMADDPFDLARLTVPRLREILRERGLSTGGTKAELLRRVRVTREGDSALGELAASARDVIRKRKARRAEAMAHAGSASSPEAISRMRGGTRFYEVSPGGEVRPMIGVEAVDTAPRRGRAKVRVSPNGELVVEQGKLTPAAERALRQQIGGDAPPKAAPGLADEPDVYELDLEETLSEALSSRQGPDPVSGTGGPSAAQPRPSRAEESGLPFQYSFERLGLPKEAEDEVVDAVGRNLDEVQKQRRAGIPMAQTLKAPERLAEKLGLTEEGFLATPAGRVYNMEEAAVLDSATDKRTLEAIDLARQIDEAVARGGDATDLKMRQLEVVARRDVLLKVSVGNASETARALRSRQEIVRALSDCSGFW